MSKFTKPQEQPVQLKLQATIDEEQAVKEGTSAGKQIGAAVADSVQKEINSKRISTWFLNGAGKIISSMKNQLSEAAKSLSKSLSLSSAVMLLVSKAKAAVSELKEIDTLLTNISKTNDRLSKSDVTSIGEKSFDVASKYGKKAKDYLSGVLEASNAKYSNAEEIAELSLALQSAKNIDAELANQMIFTTDKAFHMNGSISKLTAALDGMNYIASCNAFSMNELSEGMSIVGSTAASLGINANEAAAVLGTIMAATKQNASEAAYAFKGILLSISQLSDAENGMSINPMEALRTLSIQYNQPNKPDTQKSDLLNSIGSQNTAALRALLDQWSTYESMLQQYKDGAGSIAETARQTADSWEGSLNRLSNTWTDTIGNIAHSDAIVSAINGLNSLLSVISKLTEHLTPLATIGLGAGLFSSFKNIGKCRMSVRISTLF